MSEVLSDEVRLREHLDQVRHQITELARQVERISMTIRIAAEDVLREFPDELSQEQRNYITNEIIRRVEYGKHGIQ
jgi:hypothetical protein